MIVNINFSLTLFSEKLVVHSSLLTKKSMLAEVDTGTEKGGFELEKGRTKSHYSELTGNWMKLKMNPQGLIS